VGKRRRATLTLPHGLVQTPPSCRRHSRICQGNPQHLLEELDAQIILATLITSTCVPVTSSFAALEASSLHRLAAAMLTDSGGFQVFSSRVAQGKRRRREVPLPPGWILSEKRETRR